MSDNRSKLFITAIGTDSGKTLVSAIFIKALNASYWKPIQAGLPADVTAVKKLISLPEHKILPSRYALKTPASPHAAAAIDGLTMQLEDFALPAADPLIVEGAGGLMVPVNEEKLIIDLIQHLNVPVVLVCNLYLGSINHSLLSIEALQSRGIRILGIVFNGNENAASERVILNFAKTPCLLRIKQEETLTTQIIDQYAEELRRNLTKLDAQ